VRLLTYRNCVLGGCSIAIAVTACFATRAGLTPPLWIATASFAAASALFLAAMTKVLFGIERFAFLHYQLVTIAATSVLLAWVDAPLAPALNLLALALAIAQAFGRIGCWRAGCCHGRDGIPVQCIESALLFAIAVACALRIEHAFVLYTLAYAVTRFALELLRGDRRRHFRGLSEAQWICAITFVTVLIAGGLAS